VFAEQFLLKKPIYLILFAFIGSFLIITSRNKDKTPVINPTEPTKWEKISGEYKVYDTTGVFLYDMKITHPINTHNNIDSLFFENFDGQFNISAQQPFPGSNPEYYITFGYHPLLYDSLNNRWKILDAFDDIFNNTLINDTIRMYFRKTNINYYLQDLVPYYECYCKQIAVKQN